ncbi:hypothetical protein AMS68_007797 [Peltaster fructicola]|uniref:Uncharacterized protein n=1 Tax=Peltaster fructicola TaxID=286661 RepID=A0A6H0Y6P7_9PEZI|nr:hypothetical protein AMS68_007797 [Peltaster fructicola]
MYHIGRHAGAIRRTAPLRLHSGLRRAVTTQSETKATSTVERIESRLPKVLHRFTRPLRTAPVSHITAFLVLHELTAIVPLFGLAAFFHFSNWLPPYISEGRWVQEGTQRFGNWMRKRGWIDAKDDRRSKWYGRGEGGVRIVVELATAYAITKALLPLRLPLSIWLTPWFARWTVLPMRNFISRLWRRKSKALTAVKTPSTKSTALPPVGTPSIKYKHPATEEWRFIGWREECKPEMFLDRYQFGRAAQALAASNASNSKEEDVDKGQMEQDEDESEDESEDELDVLIEKIRLLEVKK